MKTVVGWVISPIKEGRHISLDEVRTVSNEIEKILPKLNQLGYKVAFHSVEVK